MESFIKGLLLVILGVVLGVVGIHVYNRRKEIKEKLEPRVKMTVEQLKQWRDEAKAKLCKQTEQTVA